MQDQKTKKIKKILIGIVTKLGSTETMKVRVETKNLHGKYGKVVKSHKSYLVHVTDAEVKVGDTVRITDARPFSKSKSWIYLSTVK